MIEPEASTAPGIFTTPNCVRFLDPRSYFFYTSDIFRMHLFFLIAGFFGAMLIGRYGRSGFVKHRLVRLGVPLLVFFILLKPLFALTWALGADHSGAYVGPETAVSEAWVAIVSGQIWIDGGLTHLWFLYYLLLICLLGTVLCPVIGRVAGKFPGGLSKVDRFLELTFTRFWGVLVLALPVGILLYLDGNLFGTSTPGAKINVLVLAIYGFFYAVGWVIHRQAHQVSTLFSGWRWRLPIGLLLSMGLFVCFGFAKKPLIRDWPLLRSEMAKAVEGRQEDPVILEVFSFVPDKFHDYLTEGITEYGNLNQKEAVIASIDRALHAEEPKRVDPDKERVDPDKKEREWRNYFKNRRQLSKEAPELFGPPKRFQKTGAEKWMTFAYFYGYAVCLWLFVIGTLSFFQRFCNRHSPVWRYLSESSYWVYILHMPLIPLLQVATGLWPVSSLIKIPLVVGTGLLICLLSYHYLVRSTFVGVMLNGRKHPFTPNPLTAMKG
ncbi:MAG: acyltransferase family protein [Akkermansiaceae bacterium]|nr:acyltransferase family protein [Akkermansiaceae bacterium]